MSSEAATKKRFLQLQGRHYAPFGARLARIHLGRKQKNGGRTVPRTDDEEFYLPLLGKVRTEEGVLNRAAAWLCFYSLERPHYWEGMDGKPPFGKL